MKKFKQLFETGNSAADFKVKKDDEDEGTGDKSSAGGEEDFKKVINWVKRQSMEVTKYLMKKLANGGKY